MTWFDRCIWGIYIWTSCTYIGGCMAVVVIYILIAESPACGNKPICGCNLISDAATVEVDVVVLSWESGITVAVDVEESDTDTSWWVAVSLSVLLVGSGDNIYVFDALILKPPPVIKSSHSSSE